MLIVSPGAHKRIHESTAILNRLYERRYMVATVIVVIVTVSVAALVIALNTGQTHIAQFIQVTAIGIALVAAYWLTRHVRMVQPVLQVYNPDIIALYQDWEKFIEKLPADQQHNEAIARFSAVRSLQENFSQSLINKHRKRWQ